MDFSSLGSVDFGLSMSSGSAVKDIEGVIMVAPQEGSGVMGGESIEVGEWNPGGTSECIEVGVNGLVV